ncbi:SOS response-associated peptidase [Schlesneria sp.]|uniref:SOS response-associated peptidase n=1 Tax=Schlesneria sp. TaxID=2762018 RepID=UPI002F0C706C
MCGRINLWMSPAELADVFELFREPDWEPRYNLGPMQKALAVRQHSPGERLAEPLLWGLIPSWSKTKLTGPPLNNARAETIDSKPSFSQSFQLRRCLIPANGFFEWKRLDSKSKQPWNIFRADGQPLALAGIWDRWQAVDGTVIESCAVVTTEANSFMAQIHDRMPVILEKADWKAWLDPKLVDLEVLRRFLVPCPSEILAATPVCSLVNNVKYDSPECLKRVTEVRTLF